MTQKIISLLRKLAYSVMVLILLAYLAYAIIIKETFGMWMIIGVIAINIITVLVEILRKKRFAFPPLANYIGFMISVSFFSYHEYTQSQKQNCQNSFGTSYNKTRREFGIPILPTGWKKWESIASWYKTGDSTGHYNKEVEISKSGCQITFESDDYKLRNANDTTERSLSVLTKYNKSGKPDTITFDYAVGKIDQHVTRHFADSLLGSEHLQKDF